MKCLILLPTRFGKSEGERVIRDFFAYDGKVMEFLNKLGEIILLNILFLLCCLPVVTAGASLTSFYYAMIKSVRRERGNPVKEFFRSMKRTIGRGSLLTVGTLLWLGALLYGRRGMPAGGEKAISFGTALCDVLLLFSVCALLYLFPVLSRFELRISEMLKLSFVMSIRFLPITFLLAAGSVLMGWVQFFWLPAPCILILPGVCCYLTTYLMEKALLHYMPKAEAGEEQWYDQDTKIQEEAEK